MNELSYKAWNVYLAKDPSFNEITYAETANQAKMSVLNHKCKTDGELNNDSDLEYIDLNVQRLKSIDGMAKEPLVDIVITLIKKEDWTWSVWDDNQDLPIEFCSADLKTKADEIRFREYFERY